MYITQVLNDQNTLIVQSVLTLSLLSTLNPSLYSVPGIIFNTHYPMQNPGQTQVFYKAGQTQLTWTKHDPGDPGDPDDLT